MPFPLKKGRWRPKNDLFENEYSTNGVGGCCNPRNPLYIRHSLTSLRNKSNHLFYSRWLLDIFFCFSNRGSSGKIRVDILKYVTFFNKIHVGLVRYWYVDNFTCLAKQITTLVDLYPMSVWIIVCVSGILKVYRDQNLPLENIAIFNA